MAFSPRLTKPEAGNPYYNTTSNGGYSRCIVGKPTDPGCNVLANCCGYALGRFNEIVEQVNGRKGWKYHISGNAEDFWKNRGNLFGGSTPAVGAIIVWKKGLEGNSADGAGHVAIVEKVNGDGSIVTSESGYNSAAFWTKTRYKGNGNWGANGYDFMGFIYNPAMTTPTSQNPPSSAPVYNSTPEVKTAKEWDGKLPQLAVGSKSTAVKTLQILLNAKDAKYNCGNPDGQFGGLTRSALVKYQTDFLGAKEADGVCGNKTWVSILGF